MRSLRMTGIIFLSSLVGISGQAALAESAPKVISISARKFEYTPNHITLKKGVPTVLRLITEDRSHGFSIPAMNLRADIRPGKAAELKFTPQKTGDFDFFCDIYCGEGHEGMSGKITVVD